MKCVCCVFLPLVYRHVCIFLFCSVKSNLQLFSIRFIKPSNAFLIIAVCFLLQSSASCVLFCFFSPSARSDPLHQWDEREHSPAGRHTVWAHGQLQLGGGLQSPYHYPPPHDVWQWGRRLTHTFTQTLQGNRWRLYQECHMFINTNMLYVHIHNDDNLFMSISPFESKVGGGRLTNAYGIQTVCAATEDLHIGHWNNRNSCGVLGE